MAVDSFKSIGEVVSEYQLATFETAFIHPLPLENTLFFRDRLAFHLSEFSFRESEYSSCEMVIFPILAEVYAHHRHKFVYGIVSNGQSWEFGVLTQDAFTLSLSPERSR